MQNEKVELDIDIETSARNERSVHCEGKIMSNRLRNFGKTVAVRVAMDTGDLAQPLRQTRHLAFGS